jgi:hypothetical protein
MTLSKITLGTATLSFVLLGIMIFRIKTPNIKAMNKIERNVQLSVTI